jgi:O-antigen chain-terminating methyltransferase
MNLRTHAKTLVEDSPVAVTAELEQCLNRVEYYQPLYGISGLEPPLRACRDRALAIAAALGPPGGSFRLIDFGSSLGYFPFFFADRGAVATGLDINPLNTDVARAAQRLNGLPATFRTAALDLHTVRRIAPGEYDVALVLSVLHHLSYRYGNDYVAELVAALLERVPVAVFELAHRGEPVNCGWRASLPEDPLSILRLSGAIQVSLIGQSQSHLSGAGRPLYLVRRAREGQASLG